MSNKRKPGKRPQARAAADAQRSGARLNLLLTAGVFLAAIAVIVTVLLVSRPDPAPEAGADTLVREDSHFLDTADGDGAVTVVEFLDFECEACRAAYPEVERLREEFKGEIDYVLRYFPLPGHGNAMPAALAAEAAANQDELEAMYHLMFTTQSEWGEQQTDQSAVFAGFAEEIGLDMERFRADVADPATAERVQRDVDDGIALGVQGTPTIFIGGERFEDQPSFENLKAAVEAAQSK
ncbi:thioredoxin domain-containing protein [Glycomyces sp. NPDC047010]|uniref:DsbA family protein n=1 Tax=Glycomyces sp. NPDC047010 TaxID=3155023 RepID=UPI0033EF342A